MEQPSARKDRPLLRARNLGSTPGIPLRARDLQRFIDAIDRTDGCWFWAGTLNELGYGLFYLEGHHHLARRVAFELWCGSLDEGLRVHASCGERRCVNPEHLELLSHEEICRRDPSRSDPRNTSRRSRIRGRCSHGHAMTPENTYVVPSTGQARCRQCNRDRMREHAERRRRGV